MSQEIHIHLHFGEPEEFRYSKFDITQKFAEGFDPDRVAAAFAKELEETMAKKKEAPKKGEKHMDEAADKALIKKMVKKDCQSSAPPKKGKKK